MPPIADDTEIPTSEGANPGKENEIMQEHTNTPSNWDEKAGLLNPQKPTKEEVAAAWREFADFPVTYGIVTDLRDALQTLERADLNEAEKLLTKRYRGLINAMHGDAEALLNKMKEDYERTTPEKKEEDE
jgi:hypothetical protein